MKSLKQYTLAELTNNLDVTIQGDPSCLITGVSTIQHAKSGQITFLTNALYKKFLHSTAASAVILKEQDALESKTNIIISSDPYYTYAKIAAFFEETIETEAGIHPSAIVDKTAVIDPSASIGAGCVIGKQVKIGAQVVIGAHSVIGEGSEIGEQSRLSAHVTLYHRVKIGKRAQISSGVVIGGDGFGFANHKGTWHKVPQLGGVSIGDDVDIGANTTIDRGALEDTLIGNGVKLDNLIQIGHNVSIGDHTLICGCVAIAGSTDIGKHCMIGGATCFAGHLSVCDHTMITGMTAVTKSIREPGIYSSGIVGAIPNQEFRKNNARFHRLGSLMEKVKNIETKLDELSGSSKT